MQCSKPSIYNDAIEAGTRESGPPIATWSWSGAHQAWRDGRLVVQPVRISLGVPKFWPAAVLCPFIPELAPDGSMMNLDGERFRAAYLAKLRRVGVDMIAERFEAIAMTATAGTLALCCFERDRRDCHRGLFADWWLEATGEVVPEVGSRQLTIDGEAGR